MTNIWFELININSLTTKEKIIAQATTYFNRVGFGATSLFELANEIGMSRGNLAYHFKDKDQLLQAIASQMWDRMKIERSKSLQLASFQNLHNEIQLYYRFQRQYAFIFLDTQVLNHPAIKKQFREMTQQTLHGNKAAIAFAIKLGNMKPESVPGTYHHISFITWMLTFFWLSQQIIRGEKTGEDGEKMVWSILLPHFTEKGVQSFIDFFGQDYYDNLGEAFELDIDSLISF